MRIIEEMLELFSLTSARRHLKVSGGICERSVSSHAPAIILVCPEFISRVRHMKLSWRSTITIMIISSPVYLIVTKCHP